MSGRSALPSVRTMKVLALNCSLKASPEPSNTGALVDVVLARLRELGADTKQIRVADLDVPPGVVSEAVRDGDDWPQVRRELGDADIVIVGTPTWAGRPSSLAQRVIERMDAMLSEEQDDGRPAAYDKVAGVVVTGNEDGAHHCIAEVSGALVDFGFTVPGQAWTYWNKGPGPGDEEYLTSDEQEWSKTTGRTAAQNLYAVAQALQATPMPAPAG